MPNPAQTRSRQPRKTRKIGSPLQSKPINQSASISRSKSKSAIAKARAKSKIQCKAISGNQKRLYLAKQLEAKGLYPSEDHRESYTQRQLPEVLAAAAANGIETDHSKFPASVLKSLRCTRSCAYGMEYCLAHGAKYSRNELAANRIYMAMMVTPALRRQMRIIKSSKNDVAANSAIKDVLDRNLGKETLKLEIEDKTTAASLDNLSEDELLQLQRLHHKLHGPRLPDGPIRNITPTNVTESIREAVAVHVGSGTGGDDE